MKEKRMLMVCRLMDQREGLNRQEKEAGVECMKIAPGDWLAYTEDTPASHGQGSSRASAPGRVLRVPRQLSACAGESFIPVVQKITYPEMPLP